MRRVFEGGGVVLVRVLVRVAATLCVASIVAACSVVAPSSFTGSSAPDSAGGPKPASTAPSVPEVAHPWHPGMPQLGIDVDWTGNSQDSHAVIRPNAARMIDYAIRLNANSIPVSFPFYTDGITSDTL